MSNFPLKNNLHKSRMDWFYLRISSVTRFLYYTLQNYFLDFEIRTIKRMKEYLEKRDPT
ncbi:hypothetical protein BDZ89DRAFT_407950 [Hymenopellis radicata]|nr:hypothetical protein BDZ89DRAFT_407950 [Hymenopellis radicata]